MNIENLNSKQLELAFNDHPDWTADHFMFWCADNHKDWMLENKKEFMLANYTDDMINHDLKWAYSQDPHLVASFYPAKCFSIAPHFMAKNYYHWMIVHQSDYMNEHYSNERLVPNKILKSIGYEMS